MRIFGILRSIRDIEPIHYYRTFSPLRALAGAGTDVYFMDSFMARQNIDGDPVGPDSRDCDIYTTCRMYRDDEETDFLDYVHGEGGVFIFDSDDDLTERYRLVSGLGKHFIHMLTVADYVTTSTPELAELFSEWTAQPPIVLENHIDVDNFGEAADEARRLYAGIAIGFSGTKTHWGDWYIPSVPWARIVEDYPGTIPLLHGDPPEYLRFARRPEVRAKCSYSHYPEILAQFDILLCAVNTADPFNAGKSGIKALEAMVAGAVPICSKLPAYQRLYDQGAPIVMIEEDSQDGWYEAMRGLITDEERRLHLKLQGRQWVTDNRDMGTSGYRYWAEAYQGMVSDGR